ncbi:hypothetical protein ICN48_06270 [Polynucleobacter sp. JS-Safj-400b-B2]|uniref:hypothetical protein n=1 Tax=Polynucleobacter sp. JS-Safj-400b-B2 TaxID=2576921 RepID=UPI001C0A97F9|nr:hypothetical protein [Polynucleobacter sp. JS-Safj-400b-B2]MBU3625837.1 hypothetical protein [Polynucleobacter sp. JS-Safj-400b-B2]
MNLAQRCIQQAKKRKDIPLLYSVSRKKTLGKNERKSTAEEVPARNIQKQGNMATPKQDSPNTRFKIPYRSIFLAITNIALNISITIFVFCAIAYIALTYLSGGTSFANQRIESLLSATSPTTTQPSIAVEPPTDAAPPKEELVVKKDSEDHLASEKNNPREAPLISDGPLPSGPIPKIAGKYTPPVELVVQQPVKSKRAQEGLSEDDQPVSKVKLMVVEKKAPAVTLANSPAIEVNRFEVVALTSQSVVIKTDQGMKQIQLGQALPDGRIIEAIDPARNSYSSNGNTIQVQ